MAPKARGAAGVRAAGWQRGVKYGQRSHRGGPARARAAARRLRRRVLIRTDSGGGTQDFLAWVASAGPAAAYSVGITITEDMQQAILTLPDRVWEPAMTPEPGAAGCVGRGDDRHAGPGGVAGRDAGDRPQGTPASWRATAVHRPRRPPVHRLRHRHQGRPAR